jgi:hypothetical protein
MPEIIEEKGQEPPELVPALAVAGAASATAGSLSVSRVSSIGSAGAVRPPILTPKACTMLVSPGLVTIEKREPHSGHSNVIPSDASAGLSSFSKSMKVSHFRQTNFIPHPFQC